MGLTLQPLPRVPDQLLRPGAQPASPSACPFPSGGPASCWQVTKPGNDSQPQPLPAHRPLPSVCAVPHPNGLRPRTRRLGVGGRGDGSEQALRRLERKFETHVRCLGSGNPDPSARVAQPSPHSRPGWVSEGPAFHAQPLPGETGPASGTQRAWAGRGPLDQNPCVLEDAKKRPAERTWCAGGGGWGGEGPSGDTTPDATGSGTRRGAQAGGGATCPRCLAFSFHPARGSGEAAFALPLHLLPSASPFPGLGLGASASRSRHLGRGGVGSGGLWGLEPGSGTKGEAEWQALPRAVYMERPSSDPHTASKHVASISPLKYRGGGGGGGGCGSCCQHPLDACLRGPAERLLRANSSRPVPLANGTEHLVCKLVSYWGGCGLGTGLRAGAA